MQNSQDLTDTLNDQTKDFRNIFQIDEDDINNELQSNLPDSQYFTETDFLNLLTNEKLSDQTSLKIISLNIANILSKLKSFKIFIQNLSNESNKPNIIAVTETHLYNNQNHGYTENELQNLLPGYKFFNPNRKKKKGGEVGIFVDNRLTTDAKVESNELFMDEIFSSRPVGCWELDDGTEDLLQETLIWWFRLSLI